MRCAWVVLASAGLAVIYHTLDTVSAGLSLAEQSQSYALLAFPGYPALVTWTHVRHATSVLPWMLPAAIGIPAAVLWTRRCRRRFGELGEAAG